MSDSFWCANDDNGSPHSHSDELSLCSPHECALCHEACHDCDALWHERYGDGEPDLGQCGDAKQEQRP